MMYTVSKDFKLFLALFLLAISVVFVSCKKDEEEEEEEETSAQADSPTPSFSAGNGALVAIKSQSTTQSPIGPVETTIGLGVAVFYSNGNNGAFLDAGSVKVNSTALSKQSNSSYVFQPGVTNTTGIDYNSSVVWSVAGASSVSAFSHTTSIGFPSISAITSGDKVTKSSGYTLTASGISGADSIIFQVGSAVKTVAGSSSSCTFSASELSAEPTGTSIAQVAAYKLEEASYNGKTYHFVNETVVSKTVTIE